MIDFSVFEDQMDALRAGIAYTFKSSNKGYIREVVTLAQMPASDIAATGHRESVRVKSAYEIPFVARFCTWDWDRDNSSAEFKTATEQFCAALETYHSAEVDAIRNISTSFPSESTGDGKIVRMAVITFTCLSH